MTLAELFGPGPVPAKPNGTLPPELFDRDAILKAIMNKKYSYEDMQNAYSNKIMDVDSKFSKQQTDGSDAYNYDDSIVLKTGKYNLAKVPKKLINDVLDTSKRTGVDFYDLLGLIGQESTFGGGLDERSRARGITKRDLASGWDLDQPFKPKDPYMFLADKKADGVTVTKTPHGWNAQVVDEDKLKKWVEKNPKAASEYMNLVDNTRRADNVNWFDELADRIKTKGIKSYNPGDKDYSNKVANSKDILKRDPVLQSYLRGK